MHLISLTFSHAEALPLSFQYSKSESFVPWCVNMDLPINSLKDSIKDTNQSLSWLLEMSGSLQLKESKSATNTLINTCVSVYSDRLTITNIMSTYPCVQGECPNWILKYQVSWNKQLINVQWTEVYLNHRQSSKTDVKTGSHETSAPLHCTVIRHSSGIYNSKNNTL